MAAYQNTPFSSQKIGIICKFIFQKHSETILFS